jgi:hypothetical protein
MNFTQRWRSLFRSEMRRLKSCKRRRPKKRSLIANLHQIYTLESKAKEYRDAISSNSFRISVVLLTMSNRKTIN